MNADSTVSETEVVGDNEEELADVYEFYDSCFDHVTQLQPESEAQMIMMDDHAIVACPRSLACRFTFQMRGLAN